MASAVGTFPRTAPARAVPATQVNRIVLAAFYVMVASFNFEMPDRGGWETPAMTAALFLASTPLALRACYGRLPPALLWFAGFLWVFAVSSLLHGWVNFGDVRHYAIVLVEALLVCWASLNLFSRVAVGVTALWCYVISALARSVLPMIGVGRTSYVVWTGGERGTPFRPQADFSAVLLVAGPRAPGGRTVGTAGA